MECLAEDRLPDIERDLVVRPVVVGDEVLSKIKSVTFLYHTNDDNSIVKLQEKLQDLNDKAKGERIPYKFDIKLNRSIRSNDQNRYYRACLKQIAIVTGYTTDELHDFYKKKFVGIKMVFDEEVVLSTSKLDTKEFSVFIKKVKEHAEHFHGCQFVDIASQSYQVWEQLANDHYDDMFASI